MEDKETGELFIPCRVCSHKCFKRHGKSHGKQCFDASASFFKVMLRDFEERLRIPPAFVAEFIRDQHEQMVLQGPNGQEWEVELLGTNNKLQFGHGWENFVNFYGLQLGDFVVFKYISNSHFKVQIFGRSGCVKNPSAENKHWPDQRRPSTKMIDLISDDEKSDEAEEVAENQRRKRKSCFFGHSSNKHGHGFSSEKQMTVGPSASSFKSDKPFCLVVMKSWNLNTPHRLRLPRIFKNEENQLQLPRANIEVLLLNGEGKEWKVQCLNKDNRRMLSGGWIYFRRDNNIKEGDTCIFEQLNSNLNKFMFRVYIFRHVEDTHLLPNRKVIF